MTLNTKTGLLWLFGVLRLRHTFQEQKASKSLEIDQNNMRMKLSELNVDFLMVQVATSDVEEGLRTRASKKGTLQNARFWHVKQ